MSPISSLAKIQKSSQHSLFACYRSRSFSLSSHTLESSQALQTWEGFVLANDTFPAQQLNKNENSSLALPFLPFLKPLLFPSLLVPHFLVLLFVLLVLLSTPPQTLPVNPPYPLTLGRKEFLIIFQN